MALNPTAARYIERLRAGMSSPARASAAVAKTATPVAAMQAPDAPWKTDPVPEHKVSTMTTTHIGTWRIPNLQVFYDNVARGGLENDGFNVFCKATITRKGRAVTGFGKNSTLLVSHAGLPKAVSLSVFPQGKMQIRGAADPAWRGRITEYILWVIQIITGDLEAAWLPEKEDVALMNATMDAGWKVNLAFLHKLVEGSTLGPSSVTLKPPKPAVTVKIFSSGKVNVMGAHALADVHDGLRLAAFLLQTHRPHIRIPPKPETGKTPPAPASAPAHSRTKGTRTSPEPRAGAGE